MARGRSLGLAALSGLLLAGALPAFDWGWLAWLALLPFLTLFPFRSKRAAFGHGLVLGACYLGTMAYWIIVFAAHLIGPALSTLGWDTRHRLPGVLYRRLARRNGAPRGRRSAHIRPWSSAAGSTTRAFIRAPTASSPWTRAATSPAATRSAGSSRSGSSRPDGARFPFLKALHVTHSDMKPSADRQALLGGGPGVGPLGATICFESSYPRFLREQVQRGAGLLVVSTDDAWFGRTTAARQHAAIAAVRAAECDRYLVRSAATGVSQVIDPAGRVVAEAGLFQPAVVWGRVESRTPVTPYVRWGDWFTGFCALLVIGVAVMPGGPGRRKAPALGEAGAGDSGEAEDA